MKLYHIIAGLILFGSTLVHAQEPADDSVRWAEREYYYNKYRSVRDTMTINSWINLKRVSDNLEQVVKRDLQVIEDLQQQKISDSAIIASNHDITRQFGELSTDYSRINEQLENGRTMLLYLKIVSGGLVFLLLMLLFSIISKSRQMHKFSAESDHYESLVEERQKQLDLMEAELRKLKQREMEFRDELEKGMQIHQERLHALQSKCYQLEKDNELLRSASQDGVPSTYVPSDSHTLNLPEEVGDLKQLAKSLFDERNSLINLAGKLRTQVEEGNRKTQSIVEKVNLLAKDLAAD